MKRTMAVLTMMVALLATVPGHAQQSPQQVRMTAQNGNLRQGPNTNQPIVGSVTSGTILEVIDRTGPWYRVRIAPDLGIPAQVAFVHESLVQPVGGPVAAAPPQQAYPPQQVYPQAPPSYGNGYPPSYGAQFPGARPEGYKDPTMARLFSAVVPGGGQFYTGETTKGATILGLWAAGWILPGVFAYNEASDCSFDPYSGDYGNCDPDGIMAAAYLGYAVSLGSWIYGIVDAGNAAKRANTRLGIALGSVVVQPMVMAAPSGTAGVGVNLTF